MMLAKSKTLTRVVPISYADPQKELDSYLQGPLKVFKSSKYLGQFGISLENLD